MPARHTRPDVPSTLVHVALAGLLACALLGDAFGVRSLLVVLAAVVVVDFDVFVGLYLVGAHRAAFHTLLWPTLGAVALTYDGLRERSALAERFGPNSPRIAWVTVAAVVLAGIGPDLVTNGANVFYPLHDQFYALEGKLQISNERGIVQTFVEDAAKGSTEETQYYTGIDPDPSQGGAEPVGTKDAPERIFPLVTSGFQLLLVVSSAVTVGVRLWDARDADAA
jgi:inner membrane protein